MERFSIMAISGAAFLDDLPNELQLIFPTLFNLMGMGSLLGTILGTLLNHKKGSYAPCLGSLNSKKNFLIPPNTMVLFKRTPEEGHLNHGSTIPWEHLTLRNLNGTWFTV